MAACPLNYDLVLYKFMCNYVKYTLVKILLSDYKTIQIGTIKYLALFYDLLQIYTRSRLHA